MINDPIVSVNKLGEYIVSRAARQRFLLQQRKYPNPEFNVGMYHREAADAIQTYLAGEGIDPRPLEIALNSLDQKTPEKIGAIRRIHSNVARLERFQEMLDDIDLKGANAEMGANSPEKMNILGVGISVRPEIILRDTGPKGRKLVGAIKLQLSASANFDSEAAGYVSAAVQEYCKRFLVNDDEVVHAPYCQVIDVGNGIVHPGVRAAARRMKDIEASCQNIAALWPSI